MLTNLFGSESQKTQPFLLGAVFPNLHVFLGGKSACVLANKSQPSHRDRSCRRHSALQEQRWKTSCLHIQRVLAGFDFASFDLLLLTEMSAAVYKMWILWGVCCMNWGSPWSWRSHMLLSGDSSLLNLSFPLENTFISFKLSWNNRTHFYLLNDISAH